VQPAAGIADALDQPRFDVHVNVLQRIAKGKGAGLDFASDVG
jgi:hypothetical protein